VNRRERRRLAALNRGRRVGYMHPHPGRWPRLASEQFRPAPKVPHASMLKHLRCQTLTSRAIGDKRLFREVSKPGPLEYRRALPRAAFVWHHARHGPNAPLL
jgi:hypothetical protein